jgi:transcriptional regulator with XRE-family HTH domain
MRRGVRKKRSSPVDAHVGSRIRMRRMSLGMSQQQLGAAIGLTSQQVLKYEHGVNRVSPSRLYKLSLRLACPWITFLMICRWLSTGREG